MSKTFFTVARILLGLAFTAAAIAGIMGKVPPPEPESAQNFMGVLFSSGLLYLVKALELISGLALLAGYFVPLALAILAPILVNIVFFHLMLDPGGVAPALILAALWLINAYAYRSILRPLFSRKPLMS